MENSAGPPTSEPELRAHDRHGLIMFGVVLKRAVVAAQGGPAIENGRMASASDERAGACTVMV
jgi:hypothetical protein